MTTGTIKTYETIVAERAEAALTFFQSLEKSLRAAVDDVVEAGRNSDRIGRGFLNVSMQTSLLNKETGYQRIDLNSSAAQGFISVNANCPGEVVSEISFHSERFAKRSTAWQLPDRKQIDPVQFAGYLVLCFTAPTSDVVVE
jgi:hypothetical protein